MQDRDGNNLEQISTRFKKVARRPEDMSNAEYVAEVSKYLARVTTPSALSSSARFRGQ